MNMKIIAGAFALAALAFGHSAQATQINLVTNGNFDQSSYTTNNQFGTGFGGQGVTGWTGGNGYQLYFVNGTATVDSANSQYDNGYNTGSEKFYTMPGSPTGGTGNFVALDGDQTSGIQGSISQTITGLTIGASYTVTFDWATGQLQSRSGATTDNVNVSFGNQNFTTQTISDASQSSTPWLQQSFLYTATSATETLTFLAQGTPTGLPPMVALDGISVVQTPEPASITVMATGLALLGFFYRRRQRRAV
jgi:Protein of unknown function (DUF642)/PEP-CTERM motif